MPTNPFIIFGTFAVALSLIAALLVVILFRTPAAPMPPAPKRSHRAAAPRWRFRRY